MTVADLLESSNGRFLPSELLNSSQFLKEAYSLPHLDESVPSIMTKSNLNQFRANSQSYNIQDAPNVREDMAGPVSEMPFELRAYTAMYELLFALLGLSTDHIELFDSKSIVDGRFFGIAVTDSIKNLIPLCQNYRKLINFIANQLSLQNYTSNVIKNNAIPNKGLVLQAFCSSLRSICQDYEKLVIELEQQYREDELTLPKMLYFLQPSIRLFSHLSSFILKIEQEKLYGCPLLHVLALELDLVRPDPVLREAYSFLLEAAMVPMMSIMERWICQGYLIDTYEEFFIKENTRLSISDLSEDFNSNYWMDKFTIKSSGKPSWVWIPKPFKENSSLANKILLAGKYLNALRACSHPLVNEPLNLHLTYKIENGNYLEAIESAYERANEALSKWLITEHDLYGKMASIHNVYFMQYGDAYSQFLDVNETELLQVRDSQGSNSPQSVKLLETLQSSLEQCFREGTSRYDAYLNSNYQTTKQGSTITAPFRVTLYERTLADQLARIAAMSADEGRLEDIKDNSPLTGLNTFGVDCPMPFPLSIVLSLKSLTKYQMLFRFLWQCSSTSRQLSRCITSQTIDQLRVMEERLDILRSSTGRLRALKAKLTYLLDILLHYFHMDVFSYHWREFTASCKDHPVVLEDFISAHSRFLDSCLKASLLTNYKLYRILSKLLSNCSLFITFCGKVAKELNSVSVEDLDGVTLRHQQGSIFRTLVKMDANVSFHIKLLVQALSFFGTTDFDHRIGALIFRLESGYFNEDLDNPDSTTIHKDDPFK